MPFQPGENVGPYRIIEQLGQGGMATVFKAYHPALDRYVALKVMHPAFMQDPQFLRRFQREAKVVARLDHPNIVPVYDFADHQNQPYLVMKFVEGETLKAVLDRGWPAKDRILAIVRAVGAALSYAHAQGVLHRDIKPSNILLTSGSGVFLTDFGLARIAEAGQSTLSGDQLLGTPHYISPEQARGEQNLDEGTDIYSLGIVLYQLCVGRVPFSSDTPFSIIHDHIYTPLPLPRSINAKIPEDLEKVLLKALAKDRKDRFNTVAETIEAFERAVQGVSPWSAAEAAVGAPTAVAGAAAPAAEAAAAAVAAIPPKPAATQPQEPTVPQAAAPQAPVSTVPQPVATPARRTRAWAWVLGGLGMTGLCLAIFAVSMARAVNRPVAAAALQQATAESPPGQSDPVQPPAVAPSSPLAAAEQAVGADPANPAAHKQLARALSEAGQTTRALDEYTRAAELYLMQDSYVDAAEALLAAFELPEANFTGDPRLAGLLTQALFLGAEGGQMMPLIESVESRFSGWPALPALKARSLLYLGQLDAGRLLLDQALRNAPEDPIANAVKIDGLRLNGQVEEAKLETAELLGRRPLPPWLVEHLQSVQAELGK
jgi:serine/threonine-protein kinase